MVCCGTYVCAGDRYISDLQMITILVLGAYHLPLTSLLFLQNAKNLGINTNIADVNGNTPLNLALQSENKEIVGLFRKYIVDQ